MCFVPTWPPPINPLSYIQLISTTNFHATQLWFLMGFHTQKQKIKRKKKKALIRGMHVYRECTFHILMLLCSTFWLQCTRSLVLDLFLFVVYDIAAYEKLLAYHALFMRELYGRLNKICIIFYIFMQRI